MARKKKTGQSANAKLKDAKGVVRPNPHALEFSRRPDESDRDAIGRNAIRATIGGGMTIKAFGAKYGDGLEIMGLVSALSDQAQAVIDGDLKRTEELLTVQAHTLDAIFNALAQRAALNMGEYLQTTELYLRLALKAQSQCRATLETLALIKNPPPVAFVRQQNIGVNQQVNNGAAPAREPSRTREMEIEQSKLSGDGNELPPNAAASTPTSRIDQKVEAMGEVNGSQVARR